MALQDDSAATSYSPQLVANAFVNQYYNTLRSSPENAHRFYYDSSTIGREDSNGNMTSVTTMDGINAEIMSTDYSGYVMEIETVDTQASHGGGVLILVTGSFIVPDAVKKKFTQSFFLAPQANGGYFVLNDMFRFVSEVSIVTTEETGHDYESTQRANLPAQSETSKAQERTVMDLPSAASLPVNRTGPSANGVPVKKNASVETCVKAAPTSSPAEKAATTPCPVEKSTPAPVLAEQAATTSTPAPAPAAEKAATTSVPAPPAMDVTKRTYASIVKVMRESTVAAAPTVRPKTSLQPKAAQNAEKSAVSPPKPAHAINTAPSGNKNTSKSKQHDEPGYSIFVKNLPYNATIEMVEHEFKKFGPIKPDGIQVRNSQVDRFCFGFVEFESQQSMQAAIEEHVVYFGSREALVEEKRTLTRVVNGVVTRGDDNGNAGGSRFHSGRGGYQGENFRGNNGNYHHVDKTRNEYRNHQSEYSGRGQGPQGNGYQNANSYHQNKNSYHQNGNGYRKNSYPQKNDQQRQPGHNGNGTGNGKVEQTNAPTKQTPAAA